jgi:hypothetical protein
MKKDGIQTRNRKSSSNKSGRTRTLDDRPTADALVSVISNGSGSTVDRLFVGDSISSLSTAAPSFGLQLSSSSVADVPGAVDVRSQYQYHHPNYVTADGVATSFDAAGSSAVAAVAAAAAASANCTSTSGNGAASDYPSVEYSSSSSHRLPVRLTDYQQSDSTGLGRLQMDFQYLQASIAVGSTVEPARPMQPHDYGF